MPPSPPTSYAYDLDLKAYFYITQLICQKAEENQVTETP